MLFAAFNLGGLIGGLLAAFRSHLPMIIALFGGMLVLRVVVAWIKKSIATADMWDHGGGFYEGDDERIYSWQGGRMKRVKGLYVGSDGMHYRGRGRDRYEVEIGDHASDDGEEVALFTCGKCGEICDTQEELSAHHRDEHAPPRTDAFDTSGKF